MFYDKFLELCIDKNMSPSAAAIDAGFSNAAAAGWKKGAVPRPSAIKRLAKYFGVDEDYFSEEAPEAEKNPGQMTEAELDRELIEIWKSGDENEHKALLEMARLIKSRRRTK